MLGSREGGIGMGRHTRKQSGGPIGCVGRPGGLKLGHLTLPEHHIGNCLSYWRYTILMFCVCKRHGWLGTSMES